MFGKNCHGHVIQKCYIGGIQLKRNGVIINYIDFLDILVVWCIFGTVFRIHNCLDGEFHILCSNRFTVVPCGIFCHVKCIGICLGIKIPAAGKSGNYLVVAIVGGQTVKKQNVDFSVLIHGGIDPCIITASVN